MILTKIYLHVSNSGISFSVEENDSGPEIVIESSSFGNIQTTQRILTTKESLIKLGKMFLEAATMEMETEPYIHAAEAKEAGTLEAWLRKRVVKINEPGSETIREFVPLTVALTGARGFKDGHLLLNIPQVIRHEG